MQLIDSHCHLDLEIFDVDRDDILRRITDIGISDIILPAIEAASWQRLIDIQQSHPALHASYGLHPVFINNHQAEHIQQLDHYIKLYQPVAVGEIGLDYFIKDTDKEKQLDYFQQQLDIAEKYQLPVILHVRKSHDTVLVELKKRKLVGGACHAFNGTLDQAKRYSRLGFKLGFGGTMTYPNARKIHQLAESVPLEDILLETDAPDMTGYQHKGERNSPEYLTDALTALATLKSLDIETVAAVTTKNAKQLFGI